ncbi:hypothetical protein EON81_12870 [bacterium]|nr:MAG: hypothetical protein EON81_12870 [bacterium]
MQKSMSPEEAEAVVKLGIARGSEPSKVQVDEIAEALNVSTQEVEKMLAEVRQTQAQVHAKAMADHRQRDMRRLALAFVFSLAVVAGGFGFYKYRQATAPGPEPLISIEGPDGIVKIGGEGISEMVATETKRAEEEVAAINGGMSVEARPSDKPVFPVGETMAPDGALPQLRLGTGDSSTLIPASGRSLEQVSKDVENWFSKKRTPAARERSADELTMAAVNRGETKDPGLAEIPVLIHQGADNSYKAFYLPLYTGAATDVEVDTARLRLKILAEAMGVPVP